MANEKLWLGHFDLWSDEGLPVFRHAVLFRDGTGASGELIEDLVDIAVSECERFYPAFQFVIWGGKSAPRRSPPPGKTTEARPDPQRGQLLLLWAAAGWARRCSRAGWPRACRTRPCWWSSPTRAGAGRSAPMAFSVVAAIGELLGDRAGHAGAGGEAADDGGGARGLCRAGGAGHASPVDRGRADRAVRARARR